MVKVERPDGGDLSRGYDEFVHGQASHFVWCNRGKRSVALNLKSDSGRTIVSRLLEGADVFVSNLSPAALDRVIDDERLARDYPWLVRCYITGYGPDGAFRDRKAFDLLVQGEAGVTRATGAPDAPAKCGVSVADLAAGVYSFGAICAALAARGPGRKGGGRRIDVSMFDVMTEWMMPLILAWQFAQYAPQPAGLHHASITPYGAFPTADGQLLNLAVHTPTQWVALCTVLGLQHLAADIRYETNSKRLAARTVVESAVAAATAQWQSGALSAALDTAGIPWGKLSSVAEVLAHPQIISSTRWQPVKLPEGTTVNVLGDPIRVDGIYGGGGRVPALGEDTSVVLQEVGFSPGEIDQLIVHGAISSAI